MHMDVHFSISCSVQVFYLAGHVHDVLVLMLLLLSLVLSSRDAADLNWPVVLTVEMKEWIPWMPTRSSVCITVTFASP
jgi:hypothetical protein